jgi:hypothetical protein
VPTLARILDRGELAAHGGDPLSLDRAPSVSGASVAVRQR